MALQMRVVEYASTTFNHERSHAMNQKKRAVVVSSVLGLIMMGAIALFVGNLAGCRDDGLGGSGFHPPFGHGGFHPGFMNDGLPEFAVQRLDDHVEALGLSEAQQRQFQVIREEFRQVIAQNMAMRKEFFIQLREAILAPNPDAAFIGTLVKAHAQHIPDAIESHVDLFLSFYDILDADQKALVINQAQDRFKRLESFLSSSRGSTGNTGTSGGGEDHEVQD
jgi:Spy/CpxP family protein refolding chaperone